MLNYGNLKLGQPHNATEAEVEFFRQLLLKSFGKRQTYKEPDERGVQRVAELVLSFKKIPLASGVITELRRIAVKAKKEREVLNAAAGIVREDRAGFVKYIQTHSDEIETNWGRDRAQETLDSYDVTIKHLATRIRGPSEDPGFPFPFDPKGPDPSPITVMAVRILQETLITLHMAGNKGARLGRVDGHAMDFLTACMERIFPKDFSLSRGALYDAVRQHKNKRIRLPGM